MLWCRRCIPQTPSASAGVVCRGAAKISESYPWLEQSGVIDILLPKKEQICVGKWCSGPRRRIPPPPPPPPPPSRCCTGVQGLRWQARRPSFPFRAAAICGCPAPLPPATRRVRFRHPLQLLRVGQRYAADKRVRYHGSATKTLISWRLLHFRQLSSRYLQGGMDGPL